MWYSDRLDQRRMLASAFAIQIVGMALLAIFPLTLPVAGAPRSAGKSLDEIQAERHRIALARAGQAKTAGAARA
jgi:hypothetical protein